MNSFEINKIIASILIAILIFFGIGKFADFIFKVDKPEKSAYKIEPAKTSNATASSGTTKVEIDKLLAMGDLEHGQKVFKKCSACHMIKSGGKNMIGPNLWGIIGKKSGSTTNYSYSKAMAAFGKKWKFEEMNEFLIKPASYIQGTKMAFAGLKKEKDRASIILFINSKSDNPLPTP